MYDVAIIGAGPAGIFSALEIIKLRPDWKVAVIEKGTRIEKRKCVVRNGLSCPPCNNCNLLCGWGGAGAFSDGKLTLSPDVGGNLIDYINRKALEELISYTDNIYLEYGATETVYGKNCDYDIARQATLAELRLVHSPIRHLGTDRSGAVLKSMQDYLSNKVDILTDEAAASLIVKNDEIKGIITEKGNTIEANYVIVAPGREGAGWLAQEFNKLNIELENNAVDVGVRVELPAPVMEGLTSKLYESKLVYHAPTFGDEVRTFCMNPYGEVVCENYKGIVTVNGHSYANTEKRTENTNFALLVSKRFTEPFKEPIKYGQHVASLANMLAGGVLVQRLGDLLSGRRSTPEKIAEGVVNPTFTGATPGDLSLVLPYRHLTSIVEMLMALDKIAPGVASRYTLLYGVEVKFYSSRVRLSNELETIGIKNLFAIGDGAGVTRGLIQASASGVLAARAICLRDPAQKASVKVATSL